MKKILSIDGGGIKGVFPASFLASIEEVTGKNISEHFDLIVGTSTGGIIALGLGMGYSAKEMLQFYEESGPVIFEGNGFTKFWKSLGFAKYDNTALRNALVARFGERTLSESKNRLVIPSVNLETGEVHVYKTSHHDRFKKDFRERVVDIALATSAAPSYFPTFHSSAGVPLIDGGVWANNPMGMAVVEGIGILGWPMGEIKVLSLGCTTEALDIGIARFVPMGKAYWAVKAVKVFMSAQSSASIGTAQLLAGHSNVHRISPSVANGKFSIDTVKEIGSLKGLGDSEARKALPNIEFFFNDKVEPFDPIHKP